MLNQIQNFLKEQVILIQKNSPEIRGVLKKENVLKLARDFYDTQIDKPLNLPSIVDWGVKYMLLPVTLEIVLAELKDQGIIIRDQEPK
jgi:hypothetical protein